MVWISNFDTNVEGCLFTLKAGFLRPFLYIDFMCLITFSWQEHPQYPLILVANRDEFFTRPATSLHRWNNGIYAGKDLKGGGTWMGVHPNGRFAALTNYRDLKHLKEKPISRGKLVLDFLESRLSPQEYLEAVQSRQHQFDGFNLIVADLEEMWYLSNYGKGAKQVSPGLHGLSNAFMDDPWKKVEDSKQQLSKLMSREEINLKSLAKVNMSTEEEQVENLPQTGLPIEIEKAVSAPFIKPINQYGTVNISVLIWKEDGEVSFLEKRVIKDGGFEDTVVHFSINAK